MMENPCFGCVAPKRHAGCHAECSEYKAWRAEYDAEKSAKDKLKQDKARDIEYSKDVSNRVRRK